MFYGVDGYVPAFGASRRNPMPAEQEKALRELYWLNRVDFPEVAAQCVAKLGYTPVRVLADEKEEA